MVGRRPNMAKFSDKQERNELQLERMIRKRERESEPEPTTGLVKILRYTINRPQSVSEIWCARLCSASATFQFGFLRLCGIRIKVRV